MVLRLVLLLQRRELFLEIPIAHCERNANKEKKPKLHLQRNTLEVLRPKWKTTIIIIIPIPNDRTSFRRARLLILTLTLLLRCSNLLTLRLRLGRPYCTSSDPTQI